MGDRCHGRSIASCVLEYQRASFRRQAASSRGACLRKPGRVTDPLNCHASPTRGRLPEVPTTEESVPPVLSHAGPLLANYDVIFCDVWGVVHNGVSAYE